MKNFRTYQLAKELYLECQGLKLPIYLKDQLDRASLSVALNLAEGSAKHSPKDRMRFYQIAMGSLRETQAVLDIIKAEEAFKKADQVAASLFRLLQNPGPGLIP